MAWNRAPLCSRAWANIWAVSLFVLCFALLAYFDNWWKNIPLALGLSLLLRQYLLAKVYDAIATICIFLPLYIFVRFDLAWDVLIPLPYLFIVGAILVLTREVVVEWKNRSE